MTFSRQQGSRQQGCSDEGLQPLDLSILALSTAIDQKALDPVIKDVRGASDIADYFVLISGTSQRHAKGIAEKIRDRAKQNGEPPLGVSGVEGGDWVLLDFGAVIVHVFFEPIRQYYDLDGLWAEAPTVPIPEELADPARMLRTGLYPS